LRCVGNVRRSPKTAGEFFDVNIVDIMWKLRPFRAFVAFNRLSSSWQAV
jgi:hypothetical protein